MRKESTAWRRFEAANMGNVQRIAWAGDGMFLGEETGGARKPETERGKKSAGPEPEWDATEA
jgi:hypothetical protein